MGNSQGNPDPEIDSYKTKWQLIPAPLETIYKKYRRSQEQCYNVNSVELILNDEKRQKKLPIKLHYPKNTTINYLPLLIFSHGAIDSKDAYIVLCQLWASHGYIVIQPTHSDILPSVKGEGGSIVSLGGDAKKHLQERLSKPEVWEDRVQDIVLIMDSLDTMGNMVYDIKGKFDKKRIGVGGHSYGAYTAQLLGGARVKLGEFLDFTDYSDARVKCTLLISSQGVNDEGGGTGLQKTSWEKYKCPMFVIAGSKDEFLNKTSEWMCHPFEYSIYDDIPKFKVILNGADHGYGGIYNSRITKLMKSHINASHVEYCKMLSLAFF